MGYEEAWRSVENRGSRLSPMSNRSCRNVSESGAASGKELRIISSFLALLSGQSYARGTLRHYRGVLEHFRRWRGARAWQRPLFDDLTVDRFLRGHLPRCHCAWPAYKNITRSRWVLQEFFSFLRKRRLIALSPTRPLSAKERLLRHYDRFLDRVCGLAETTRRGYGQSAERFLQTSFRRRPVSPRKLRARHIAAYVDYQAKRLQGGSVRALATALRRFLRFLQGAGLTDKALAGAVCFPALTARNPLPPTLSEAQVRTFLGSFDREGPIGRRDFAMALCLCRLGLRAQEVANLELDDLDWQNRTLHLRETKSRRARVLPLPTDVATAIAQYVRGGRPSAQKLFARHRVPGCAEQGVDLVRSAMCRAFIRAGLGRMGAHRLRHTLATRLHCRGVDIKTIADLLGHRDLDTTAHYARVNFQELRQAALPWPTQAP